MSTRDGGTFLAAVVLDWAGTTVDHGSRAPVVALQRAFERHGVALPEAEARGPMGRHKRDHVRAVLAAPAVEAQWSVLHGRPPSEDDAEEFYASFVAEQLRCIADFAAPVPGALSALAAFRARGLKVGSTTGYTRAMMDVLVPAARAAGYEPDVVVCPDEVPGGRPRPWMCYANAIRLAAYPLWAMVKVGDTPVDMLEGRAAGMWTVGVVLTGNGMGLDAAQLAALPDAERTRRARAAAYELTSAGAHMVVDRLADVPGLLDGLEARLADGELP